MNNRWVARINLALARHASLTMTQRYIEMDVDAQRKVVELI